MNGPAPLFVGLGGVGRSALSVLINLKDRRQAHSESFLWVDQDYQVAMEARMRLFGGESRPIPAIGLAGVEARAALTRLVTWNRFFKWLPEGEVLRILNEIGPTSAAGFRFLGRLSLVRAPHPLDSGLRRALGRLSEQRSLLKDIVLIASAEGGTGSSILADVSILIRHLLPGATVTVFLVLPPGNLRERLRFNANSYATLKELAAIHRGVPFDVFLEGQAAVLPRDYKDELWHRMFVFAAEEHELPPYEATLERMVGAISLMFDEDMYHYLHESSASHEMLDVGEARKLFFSTCGGFRLRLNGHATPSLPALVISQPSSAPAPQQREPTQEEVFYSDVRAIKNQRDEDLLELRDSLRELRGDEIRGAHLDISKVEEEILLAARSNRFPIGDATHGGWWELLPGGRRYESSIPSLLKDVEELFNKAQRSWPVQPRPRKQWWVWLPVERNYWLEQRIDTLRAIFKKLPQTESERQLLEIKPVEIVVASVEPENAGNRELMTAAWKKVGDIRRTRVFVESAPSSATKRVIVFLPDRLPDAERQSLEAQFQALAGQLSGRLELRRSSRDDILFFYEDLFHPADDIARLPDYRKAYESFGFRAVLHTDRAFVDYSLEQPTLDSPAAEGLKRLEI